jgi:tryptophan synthase alpha chain
MPGGGDRLGHALRSDRDTSALVPYLTAGYPSLDATLEMLLGLERAGAAAVEVGIPFSDPIADGPEIQRSSEWALRSGVGPDEALALVARFRERSRLPVVVMTYANPVLRDGASPFAARAAEAGVDGVLISDLPPDEAPEVWQTLEAAGLATVVLVAPTTTAERLPRLLERCRGFVYCLARTGVTGVSGGVGGYAGGLEARIDELRSRTSLPIAVGFGISNAEQARRLRGRADAVVVGAAFMRAVGQDPARGAVERVVALGRELQQALAG